MPPGKNIVAWIALSVSFVSLFFGGLLNSLWQKTINEAALSCVVKEIRNYQQDVSMDPLTFPPELIQKTKKSKFFPTLTNGMTMVDLQKAVQRLDANRFQETVVELRQTLDDLERNEGERSVSDIWEGVSSEAKSTLFAMRALRIYMRTLRPDPSKVDEAKMTDLLAEMEALENDGQKSGGRSILQSKAVRQSLTTVMMEIMQAQANPVATNLAKIIRADLPEIQNIAKEMGGILPEVTKLMEQRRARENARIQWEFRITLFNSGGVPASLFPSTSIAFPRQGKDNKALLLVAKDVGGNIIVAPGQALDVTLFADSSNDPTVLSALVGDFEKEERDFRIVFQQLNGKFVLSDVSAFSPSIGTPLKERLRQKASGVTFEHR